MKLVWKIIIAIVTILVIAVIIFVGIKYSSIKNNIEPDKNNKISKQENTVFEDYPENEINKDAEEEIKFVENVKNIIDEIDSEISSINRKNDYLDIEDLIYSERSFLRKLNSLNTNLKSLSYPISCANYRNNLCSAFDDICMNERRSISSLEVEDYDGSESYLGKMNNSLDNFINSYNSMLTFLQNKY